MMVVLRDWNGLSDTVLKVGHSVAEVIPMQESAVSNAV